MTYDPCISRQTPIYMKRPDVLKAIHADTHPNPNWPRDRPGWRYGKGYAVYTVAQLENRTCCQCECARRVVARVASQFGCFPLPCMTGDEKEDIALLFPKFFKQAPHWKIAVVSGTADAAVPFLGTERWMECLNQPVLDDWKLWYMNGDVAVRATLPFVQ